MTPAVTALLVTTLLGWNEAVRSDVSKSFRERPVENMLKGEVSPVTPDPAPRDAGGHVAPGAVSWHADLDAARTAALASGKPVLLFQLLGRLDDAFC